MLSFFRKPKPAPTLAPVDDSATPKAGQQWRLKPDDGDPWGSKYPPCTILDTKEGWVRYRIGQFYDDERMQESIFVQIYEKVA